MLIRFRGGRRGIADYLKTGKKKGRAQTRDELDERVVLSGDLDAVQAAIDAMVGKQERYLHITLSFREDQIPLGTLKSITEQFRRFVLAAYRDDEALFYAEAHLPRIKTLMVEGMGEPIDRLAHIHVVVPKINLLTSGPLNPFGKVARQIPYIDAIQEVVNARFGLASPKDHRRVDFSDRSDILSRTKGDRFQGANRDLKEAILKMILEQDLKNLAELRTALHGLGEVKVRNPESDQPYLNLKTSGAPKGINLKEVLFSKSFLALSHEQKLRFLEGTQEKEGPQVPGPPRGPDAKSLERLEQWFQYRAKEVKYLNSGNKALWDRYQKMSMEEKMNTLDGLEKNFYQKHAVPETLSPLGFIGPATSKSPEEQTLLEVTDSHLGQAVVDEVNRLLDQVCASRLAVSGGFSEAQVLADLQKSHGVDARKVGKALNTAHQDGILGLYRFLRGAMNWEPHRSWVYLVRSGLAPRTVTNPVSREASELLWQAFKKRKKQLEEERELSEAQRKAELSALQMSLVLSRKHLWALAQDSGRTQQIKASEKVSGNGFSAAEPVAAQAYQAEQVYRSEVWSHRVLPKGDVEYFRQEQRVCTDKGERISVDQDDRAALEISLRLAVLKWGPAINVYGSEDFKAKTVAQAARMKINIRFKDPQLQKELSRLRDQWER